MWLVPSPALFAAVAIDVFAPLPRNPEGYEYSLVICDRLTEVTSAVRLRDITAVDVLSALLDMLGACYGFPTHYCRITDRRSPPCYFKACGRFWGLKTTVQHLIGRFNGLMRRVSSNCVTGYVNM